MGQTNLVGRQRPTAPHPLDSGDRQCRLRWSSTYSRLAPHTGSQSNCISATMKVGRATGRHEALLGQLSGRVRAVVTQAYTVVLESLIISLGRP